MEGADKEDRNKQGKRREGSYIQTEPELQRQQGLNTERTPRIGESPERCVDGAD